MTEYDRDAENIHFQLKGQIWIDCNDDSFLGCGRIRLLEKIAEKGSISKAAKAMKISYRNAWKIVADINRQAPSPLIETTTGGRGGGGAYLTESGRRVLETFNSCNMRFQEFLCKEGEILVL